MNLKQFVKEALIELVEGVTEAQSSVGHDAVNPMPRHDTKVNNLQSQGYTPAAGGGLIQQVEFDVALTTSKATETKGGIGLFVAGIGLGSQGQSDSANTSISRIKFKVPVRLPSPTKE
jgi:hypothetical protein